MSTLTYAEKRAIQTEAKSGRAEKAMVWAGRALSALPILFLLMDAVIKLITPMPAFVAEAGAKLGYPAAPMFGIGLILLVSTILYAIPRTSVLGAILLTGYLGGASSTHVRVQDGAFNTLFPVIFGTMVWGGLYLRDSRVRALLPLRIG